MQSELPHVWLPGIVERIAQYLDDNEVACTLRLVDKATSGLFKQYCLVQLSRPVPPHAFHYHWTKPDAMRTLSFIKRRKLLAHTAASGCLPNLRVAVAHAGCDLTAPPTLSFCPPDPLAAAAAAGHLHITEWLLQLGCPLALEQLAAAARAGRQEACLWLLDHGCPWHLIAAYQAAEGGHLDLAQWLLTHQPGGPNVHLMLDRLLASAATGCNLATLQQLYFIQGQPGDAEDMHLPPQPPQPPQPQLTVPERITILAAAARSPTPDWQAKVEWLEQRGYPQSISSHAGTAWSDMAQRLLWLQARGYQMHSGLVLEAALAGDVAALRVLLAEGNNGIPPDGGNAASMAASGGHLAALQVLHGSGWLANPMQCLTCALRSGHLDVVAWLVEGTKVVTLDQLQQTTRFLDSTWAKSATVKLLEWLHERGCRVGMNALKDAAVGGREEVLEWLVAHGYRFPDNGTAYEQPIQQGDLATLHCLRRLGCPWGPGVKALQKGRCPSDVRVWLDAALLPYELVSENKYAQRRRGGVEGKSWVTRLWDAAVN